MEQGQVSLLVEIFLMMAMETHWSMDSEMDRTKEFKRWPKEESFRGLAL